MGYIVKLIKKNGELLGRREYLQERDINNDGIGHCRGMRNHATIYDTKEEIYSDEIQRYLELIECDFTIEEVEENI